MSCLWNNTAGLKRRTSNKYHEESIEETLMAKVSIVVPIYNVYDYLDRNLESSDI